jgi:hypothetical protein
MSIHAAKGYAAACQFVFSVLDGLSGQERGMQRYVTIEKKKDGM